MKKLTILLGLLLINASYAQSIFKGSEGGGGGDASEERVSEIRADILSWIQKGGSRSLKLPEELTYEEYEEKMSSLLQPKAVVVTFVDKDHDTKEELQVMVDGKPKTCRGFFSKSSNQPHILCNISRFKETSPSDQYSLIHHEYAGLAYLERNEGAASDYVISNQLSGYLEKVTTWKLALKASDIECGAYFKDNNNKALVINLKQNDQIELKISKQTFENKIGEFFANGGCENCMTQFQYHYKETPLPVFSSDGELATSVVRISTERGDQVELRRIKDFSPGSFRGKTRYERADAEIIFNGQKLFRGQCHRVLIKR